MSTTGDFSPYVAFEVEGRRIGIVTCLRCGAAVLLDEEHATVKHLAWHLAHEDK